MERLQRFHELEARLGQLIIGQQGLIRRLLIALLADGHVLLEGPPGVAKTTAVHALANSISGSFQRIQVTPDLLPGDLLGGEIFDQDSRQFRFIPGPLFHQIVLADEVNRAPPKVQAALVEAMAEHQVTVAGQSHPLPTPFIVLATQNPIEQSGTYPLPEAQLDRFLLKVLVDYPTLEHEIAMVERYRSVSDDAVAEAADGLLQPEQILAARKEVSAIFIEASLQRYAVELVAATRNPGGLLPGWKEGVRMGASPRGSLSLLRAASAQAWLEGRDYVIPDDLLTLASDVLRHRVVLSFSHEAMGLTADHLIEQLLVVIPAP